MIKLINSWYKLLGDNFEAKYFKDLQSFLDNEYSKYNVFPPAEFIFNALNLTPLEKVKVVIIGQDPYHEKGQAQGLAFSVSEGTKIPPSLVNIFKEINSELNVTKSNNGDLTDWAKQGVLLLNTVLTVREAQANSHQNKGWENLTEQIIKIINEKKEHCVFILWGNNAKKFSKIIDSKKHLILMSAHPSPLSAHNGFFGCGHFKKTNEYLVLHNNTPIAW